MSKVFKRTFFFLLAALIVLAAYPICTQARAASEYLAENVEMQVNGVQCTVDFRSDYTASIWQVTDPGQSMEWDIPETIHYEIEGCSVTDFPVVRLNITSSSAANITSLTLPDTLTDLAYTKFSCFPRLTELTIPGSVKVFTASFQNMTSLEKITFAEGVEEIASNSMVNRCSALKEIVLPDSLESITEP